MLKRLRVAIFIGRCSYLSPFSRAEVKLPEESELKNVLLLLSNAERMHSTVDMLHNIFASTEAGFTLLTHNLGLN